MEAKEKFVVPNNCSCTLKLSSMPVIFGSFVQRLNDQSSNFRSVNSNTLYKNKLVLIRGRLIKAALTHYFTFRISSVPLMFQNFKQIAKLILIQTRFV